jgi:hypothetical protein
MKPKKMKRIFYIFLFFVFSCSNDKSKSLEELVHEPNDSVLVFSNFYFLDPDFKRLNFPFWFDEALISNNNIAQITIIKHEYIDTLSLINSFIQIDFSTTGAVKQITRAFYDNAVEIKRDVIQYKKSTDEFKSFKLKSSEKRQNKTTSFDYIIFNVGEKQNDSYSIYESADPAVHPSEIYIFDKEKQNVSFVDQLSNKFNNVYYFYGNIDNYTKAFFQEDLVQRQGEKVVEYFPNTIIKSVRKDHKNYFEESRFIYDSIGRINKKENRTFTADSSLIDIKINEFEYQSDTMHIVPHQVIQFIPKNDSIRKRLSVQEFSLKRF